MGTLIQDLKYGLRMFAKNPGFTAIALLTLALGIGANTAIFSMANGILLRALPYPVPQRLYAISERVPQWGNGPVPVAGGNFLAWKRGCPGISALALIETSTKILTGGGSPRQIVGARVSAAFFPMLGVRPELGRLFMPEEDEQGRNHEVIFTHQLWEQDFHRDPNIIGRPVDLNGASFTVVGVLPANFPFPKIAAGFTHLAGVSTPALFEPLGLGGGELRPGFSMHNFQCIARLKAGVSPQQALAQLNAVETRIARENSSGKYDLYAIMTPLKTAIVGPAEQALWMLVVAAAFVLLIICANLANLMLVRNSGRAHEIAMRAALGASRWRLARQLVTEGMILGVAGGALGLWAAVWGLDLLVKNAPIGIPRVSDIHMDLRVLGLAVALSVISGLLFTLMPALRLARIQPGAVLKSTGPSASVGKASQRLRSALVAGEIALCGVLLSGALLLVSSLTHVVKANDWLAEEHVLALKVMSPPAMWGYDTEAQLSQRAQFFSEVRQKVSTLPGVRAAGFVSTLPLEGEDWGDGVSFQEAPRPDTETPIGDFRFVSPGYFRAIGLPRVRGRFLEEADSGQKVALISESAARSLPPGRDPIGMHVHASGSNPVWLRVIGVVGDYRTGPDTPPVLSVYEPNWVLSRYGESLVVRTAMDPRAAAGAIRRVVSNVSAEAATSNEQTLNSIVQTSEAPRRYETFLGALFAICAAFLAALGLYGVVSSSVSQRIREIGIRMALGAQRGDVLKLVVGQGFKLTLLGVSLGILGALALTRFLSSLLFGVKPTDPLTFVAVSVILTAVALAASYIPARRATKVDPMVALRYE